MFPRLSPRAKRSRKLLFEQLEDRRVLATYTWTDAAHLLIRLDTDESVTVSRDGADVVFALNAGQTFVQEGGDAATHEDSDRIIRIDHDELGASVEINNVLAAAESTNDVEFAGSGSLASQSIIISILNEETRGSVQLNDFDLSSTGAGGVALRTLGTIFVDGDTSIQAGDGDILLQADATPAGNIGVDVLGTISTSGSGNINLIGRGGVSGVGIGVRLAGLGQLEATGTGAITIDGIGAGLEGTDGNTGVLLENDATVISKDGDIFIVGTAGVGISTAIELLAPNSIGVITDGSANVTLVGDSITIAAADAIEAGANTVTLRPLTVGTPILLGGTDTASTLGLTDDELDRIAAGTLVIGSSASGAISIVADIDRSAATHVELHSGGEIVFDDGRINTAGGNLLLAPGVGGVLPITAGTDAAAQVVSFAPSSQLTIDIGGTTVDTGYTQLNVVGTVDLTGVQLALAPIGDFTPTPGDVFTIVSASEVQGEFAGLVPGRFLVFNGVRLRIAYTETEVTLTAEAIPPASVGVWFGGRAILDANRNFHLDPINIPGGDRAVAIGRPSDQIFAGDFGGTGLATLAAYGQAAREWRWLIDFDGNGVLHEIPAMQLVDGNVVPARLNGVPIAGRFTNDPRVFNDQVAIFTGKAWHIDTTGDFVLDTVVPTNYRGYPIVGDFDNNGTLDVMTYLPKESVFFVDLGMTGEWDHSFRVSIGGVVGIPGVRDRPVAADFNGDGLIDLGIWVPSKRLPGGQGEWFLFQSGALGSFWDRIQFDPGQPSVPGILTFRSDVDLHQQFGGLKGMPVAASFFAAPPPAEASPAASPAKAPNGNAAATATAQKQSMPVTATTAKPTPVSAAPIVAANREPNAVAKPASLPAKKVSPLAALAEQRRSAAAVAQSAAALTAKVAVTRPAAAPVEAAAVDLAVANLQIKQPAKISDTTLAKLAEARAVSHIADGPLHRKQLANYRSRLR